MSAMDVLVWLTIGITVVSYVLALVARWMQRRVERELTYDWKLPEPPGGMSVLAGRWQRAAEAMIWGSSISTWERRCEASLRASRRRRGLER